MRRTLPGFGIPAVLALFSTSAQTSVAVPATVPAGLANDWLRQQDGAFKAWDLGGQFRTRFENRDHFAIAGSPGAVDFCDHGADADDTYGLFRTKLHLSYAPIGWAKILVEGRDTASLTASLRTLRDLYERHIDVEDHQVFPLAARLLNGDELSDVGHEMARRRGLDPVVAGRPLSSHNLLSAAHATA